MIFAPASAAPLARPQLYWLAALVAVAQLPLWPHLPVWISAVGSGLIAVRLLLPADHPLPTRLKRWLLPLLALAVGIGVRLHYGYFLARDPCVAFLYVLVGIKLVETRSARDGGLLVCLALFLALTPFFYAHSIGAAAMALPVVLALGGALAALRETPAAQASWTAPLAATARLLVQGVPLAALLFILFPRLAGPLWGSPGDAGARSGLSDRMAPGAISELSLSDTVVFRVDFVGPPPPSALRYWRGPVLSRFDGFEWSVVRKLRGGRFPTDRSRAIQYTVTMEPNNRIWLFALERPASLPRPPLDDVTAVPGRAADIAALGYDQQLYAAAPVTQAIRYSQRSVLSDRFAAVDDSEFGENLQLPRGNPRTVEFARDLRRRSGSDRAFIAAVLDWFRNEAFVYTLEHAEVRESDRVDGFLFDTRRGFCEHYAGAFVFLLRAAGIPARVVTGFQGGEINPDGGYMIVRESDAHAWAEALIDGVWQRFDPTAAIAPARIERGLGAALPRGEQVPYLARLDMTWLKSLSLHWDAVNYQWQRGVVGFNLQRQRDVLRDLGLEAARPWHIVALMGAFALAWGMVILVFARTRHARADAAVALWSQLCRRLARAGLPRNPSEGPLAYTARAASRWPQSRSMLEQVGEAYATLRYGPRDEERARLIDRLRSGIAALPSVRTMRS